MRLGEKKGRKKGVKGVRIEITDLSMKDKTYSMTVHDETPQALFEVIKFMIVNMARHKKFKLEVTQRQWQKKE